MGCGAQVDGDKDEGAGDGAVKPLALGCGHSGDGDVDDALGEIVRRDC